MKIAIAISLFLGSAAFATPHQEVDLAALAAYKNWHLVTPKPVDMSPMVASLCRDTLERSPANPHSRKVFKVYVNEVGVKAFASNGKEPYPTGTMIVKEKFLRPPSLALEIPAKLTPGAKPELLTAMIKRKPGFDSKNGDWQYLVLSADSKIKSNADVSHCASCHRGQESRGFVFSDYSHPH